MHAKLSVGYMESLESCVCGRPTSVLPFLSVEGWGVGLLASWTSISYGGILSTDSIMNTQNLCSKRRLNPDRPGHGSQYRWGPRFKVEGLTEERTL